MVCDGVRSVQTREPTSEAVIPHPMVSDTETELLSGAETLTRFDKIATQGAPQMAVDKEANSLFLSIYPKN